MSAAGGPLLRRQRPLHILLDLSGTLHVGDVPTPGAVAALARLRAWLAGGTEQKHQEQSQQQPPQPQQQAQHRTRGSLRFCSNTTKASPAKLRQTLLAAGFAPHDVPEAALYTSLSAAARALAQLRQPALLLLSPSAMEVVPDDGDGGGIAHFRPSAQRLPAQLDAQERRRLEACTAVVVGLAPELMRAEWLDEAFRVLSGEYAKPGEAQVERRIIATHRANYFRPAPDAPLSMGPGPFITALETAARIDAKSTLVCGKPTADFFQGCLRAMRGAQPLDGERNIVVGDDVDADLGDGAVAMGLERVLVKTGKYRDGDERRGTQPPDALHDSFAAWVDSLLGQEEGTA